MSKKRVLTERQRLTKNIKQTIRRATKRGYIFDVPDFKTISIEELRNLSGKGIYTRSSYVLKETGEVVSGTTGVHIERQAAARKGLATKAKRKALADRMYDEYELERYYQAVLQEAYDRAVATIDNLKKRIVNMQMPEGYSRTVKGKTFTHKFGWREQERIFSAKVMLLNYIDGEIALLGVNKVAENYNKNMEEINDILDYLMKYGIDENDYTGGNAKLSLFATLLAGRPLSQDEYDDLDTIETGLNYVEDMN